MTAKPNTTGPSAEARKLAIWWLDEAAIDLMVALSPVLPQYILDELDSMHGRSKRGRLWVAERFGDDVEAGPWPEGDFGRMLGESFGGIVVAVDDVVALAFLPGIVTDLNLTPITIDDVLSRAREEACREALERVAFNVRVARKCGDTLENLEAHILSIVDTPQGETKEQQP